MQCKQIPLLLTLQRTENVYQKVCAYHIVNDIRLSPKLNLTHPEKNATNTKPKTEEQSKINKSRLQFSKVNKTQDAQFLLSFSFRLFFSLSGGVV